MHDKPTITTHPNGASHLKLAPVNPKPKQPTSTISSGGFQHNLASVRPRQPFNAPQRGAPYIEQGPVHPAQPSYTHVGSSSQHNHAPVDSNQPFGARPNRTSYRSREPVPVRLTQPFNTHPDGATWVQMTGLGPPVESRSSGQLKSRLVM